MQAKELIPGTLVTHQDHGVSRILNLEQSTSKVVLQFPSGQERHILIREALDSLSTCPSGGLADFLYNDGDAAEGWVYSNPLKLVGLTLVDLEGSGKTSDIRARLEPILPAADNWKRWWGGKGNVSNLISDHPANFGRQGSQSINLLTPVDDIPVLQVQPPKKNTTARTNSRTGTHKASATVQELEAILEQQREAHAAELKILSESHAAELALQRQHYIAELQLQRGNHAEDLEVQRQAFREDRETYSQDLKRMNHGYDVLLNGERSLVEGLRNQIAQRREESRLDIRRGMLETIADTLKNIQGCGQEPHDKLLSEVKVGLEIALLAGGARWYGQPGEIVEFDPRHHEGIEGVAKGVPVKVQAKGAIVPGDLTPDFVLMKARVVVTKGVK